MTKRKNTGHRNLRAEIAVFVVLVLIIVAAAVIFYRRTSLSLGLSAATAAGDYLLRHLDQTGRFDYLYDPLTDEVASSYNIIRHAGTTYALFELYGASGRERYRRGGERAREYLLAAARSCGPAQEFLCVAEDGEIKLGGNALAVLALTEEARVTGKRDYIREAEKLAGWMLSVQNKEGEFTVHKMNLAGEAAPGVSVYYPGEALFALVRLYEATGNEKYLKAASSAAAWLINVRDRGLAERELPHDHWLLYGLNELYDYDPQAFYADQTERIVRSIIALQHRGLAGKEMLWNGGYYVPPRSTPTATRSEGLAAAYELLAKAGRLELQPAVYEALENGVRFELRTQITKDKIRLLNLPPASLGGFSESLTDLSVRIDYVQHNISALLGLGRVKDARGL